MFNVLPVRFNKDTGPVSVYACSDYVGAKLRVYLLRKDMKLFVCSPGKPHLNPQQAVTDNEVDNEIIKQFSDPSGKTYSLRVLHKPGKLAKLVITIPRVWVLKTPLEECHNEDKLAGMLDALFASAQIMQAEKQRTVARFNEVNIAHRILNSEATQTKSDLTKLVLENMKDLYNRIRRENGTLSQDLDDDNVESDHSISEMEWAKMTQKSELALSQSKRGSLKDNDEESQSKESQSSLRSTFKVDFESESHDGTNANNESFPVPTPRHITGKTQVIESSLRTRSFTQDFAPPRKELSESSSPPTDSKKSLSQSGNSRTAPTQTARAKNVCVSSEETQSKIQARTMTQTPGYKPTMSQTPADNPTMSQTPGGVVTLNTSTDPWPKGKAFGRQTHCTSNDVKDLRLLKWGWKKVQTRNAQKNRDAQTRFTHVDLLNGSRRVDVVSAPAWQYVSYQWHPEAAEKYSKESYLREILKRIKKAYLSSDKDQDHEGTPIYRPWITSERHRVRVQELENEIEEDLRSMAKGNCEKTKGQRRGRVKQTAVEPEATKFHSSGEDDAPAKPPRKKRPGEIISTGRKRRGRDDGQEELKQTEEKDGSSKERMLKNTGRPKTKKSKEDFTDSEPEDKRPSTSAVVRPPTSNKRKKREPLDDTSSEEEIYFF